MSDVYFWVKGEAGPSFSGTLQRQTDEENDVWEDEDLTGKTVTVTLYLANGKVWKQNQPVTLLGGGRVKYVGVVADTQQGMLTGHFFVTYADNSTHAFPKPGRFQVRVSQ